MSGFEIIGTYGSNKTETTIYCYRGWYVCHGSKNVNRTDEHFLIDGVDVEELKDYDVFTWSKDIESLNELIEAVES